MITSSIKKYIEIYSETNGRTKTHWNGAETAKMLRTYQNLYQETKKMFLCLFLAIFDP